MEGDFGADITTSEQQDIDRLQFRSAHWYNYTPELKLPPTRRLHPPDAIQTQGP